MPEPMLVLQASVGLVCVALLVGWLKTRGSDYSRASTFKQLLVWYPLSAPWLLVRAPLLYLLVNLGLPLWAAVVIEFLIERPLFYLTAREIADKARRSQQSSTAEIQEDMDRGIERQTGLEVTKCRQCGRSRLVGRPCSADHDGRLLLRIVEPL